MADRPKLYLRSNETFVGREAKPKKTHVAMKRNPEQWPAPHTADVHVDEVDNWSKHGWKVNGSN